MNKWEEARQKLNQIKTDILKRSLIVKIHDKEFIGRTYYSIYFKDKLLLKDQRFYLPYVCVNYRCYLISIIEDMFVFEFRVNALTKELTKKIDTLLEQEMVVKGEFKEELINHLKTYDQIELKKIARRCFIAIPPDKKKQYIKTKEVIETKGGGVTWLNKNLTEEQLITFCVKTWHYPRALSEGDDD